MDLNDIECFYSVAEAGSLSRVARERGVEQSTLTRHISKLEQEIGVKLFHRSGRGMTLNDKGKVFHAHASRIVKAASMARAVANDLSDEGPARISIGAQPTIAQQGFPSLCKELKKKFPVSKIRFSEGMANKLIADLQDGVLDAAILYLPEYSRALQYEHLFYEELYCAGPTDARFDSDEIDIETFLELPLVLPSTMYGLRATVETHAARLNKHLNLYAECDGSTFLTRKIVEKGNGYTVLPYAALMEDIQRGKLTAAKIKGLKRSVVIATASHKLRGAGLWKITDLIRSTINKVAADGHWPGIESEGPQ